jgi:hypothetical protein
MSHLGHVESYEAAVTGPTPDEQVQRLDWGSISWNRLRSEVSESTVTCPVPNLIDHRGRSISTWRHGLAIYRNWERVWWGPITRISTQPGGDMATVQAHDAVALTSKRVVEQHRELTNVDLGTVFATLLDLAGDLRGLTTESVPESGRRVYLHYKANLSSGGDSYEIVDAVHPDILRLAERAAAC